jgi:hypothetical protein
MLLSWLIFPLLLLALCTGCGLLAKEGRPTYCYNLLGIERLKATGRRAVGGRRAPVRMEFA